ncbi:cyanophycinase [Rufibacter glacialis]|uniref:Cyanophycinase n=1 Tax=Rufibacter glacialis TaxID=1259555 RepID=A0A5M8QEH1_9BACT|nr:cyanophycinase [Rufibacter glacialis]KAA6434409.1 cyanophycinase [Rufibacter glacialis]GGK69289.1 cyanophycinase [Rufibacter glacialis]
MTKFEQAPKGILIAVGGNEDKGTYPRAKKQFHLNFFELGILKRIIDEMGGPEARVEVITTASMIPEELGALYLHAFQVLGCKQVKVLDIREEADALKPEKLERLRQASGVMFTGGDQSRLFQIFSGTAFHQILLDRYRHEEGFVIAGTSAGAMAMSDIMIQGGSSSRSLLKGSVKLDRGLAFQENVIFDSHFVKRGRFGRLMEAVATHPFKIGIGLGEDTGVLISQGHLIETIGSNLVIVVDGHHIQHSNASYAAPGTPLSIENLRVHVLAFGNFYDIRERKFYVGQKVHQPEE